MNIRSLPPIVFLLILTVSPPAIFAEWRVHPATEFDEEVRVWASPKESGMDFSWSGRVNANHEAEGYGILEWFRPGQSGPQTSQVYTGEMKSGRCHGMGAALYRSGGKYSGEWSQNLKQGKGEYWYANGDYYAGSFRDDLMHGAGRYVSADGAVFEGTFVADERDGPGVITYPDGRRYASTWSAGKDTNPSGAPATAKPYLMLGIDVRRYALGGKIFSENPDDPKLDDAHCLTYRGRLTEGDFVIEPNWPYWAAWSKGGPVVTGGEFTEFDVGVFPVFLDIRVFNPGSEKLAIQKAEVVVEESIPDLEPILTVQDASWEIGGVTCRILNFGLGRVDSCEIAFNILPRDAEPKFDQYEFLENLERFSEKATFSLQPALEATGIDADAIAAIERARDDDPARESIALRAQEELRKFPKFVKSDGDLFSAYALISGEIRIRWTDYSGSQQSKNVKFVLTKCLGFFWAEFGALGAPTGSYDIFLRTEANNYVVPFKYRRTINPGGNDRFTLQVASEVSTYQNFRIRLTTADGREIISPRCRMHFLVPRNHSWKEGYVVEDP